MPEVVEGKTDDQFRFTAQSMYRAYKGNDFADKKQSSPTLTVALFRILRRTKPELFV